ncbi:Rne/Rng family ribonuclease [Metabacillus sp. 84]|uniref:Rne/Rng family ribonuclease n=1 Tax=Metabacillus sp. 84 TaxID=3404705 RepID=UPI003CFA35EE
MKTLIVQTSQQENRIALFEHGKLTDVKIIRSSRQGKAGSIYLGKVEKVIKGMQAAFVDIGLEKNGFIRVEDLPEYRLAESKKPVSSYLHEGQKLIVQIKKEGDEWKGPALTANIEIPGHAFIYMPFGGKMTVSRKLAESDEKRLREWGNALLGNGEGILIRTAAAALTNEELEKEFAELKNQWKELLLPASAKAPAEMKSGGDLLEAIVSERPLTAYGSIHCSEAGLAGRLKRQLPEDAATEVLFMRDGSEVYDTLDAEIQKLQKKAVWLKNGAYLLIEKTEALHVIDVNSGKYTGKDSQRRTVLETNREAASEAARQIRLRNLSGIILIDFIDMKDAADQESILSIMQKQFERDRIQTRIIGFTELNLLQITRKKTSEDISTLLSAPCRVCSGNGRVESAETAIISLERVLQSCRYMDYEAVWVQADSEVAAELHKRREELEQSLHFRIMITSAEMDRPGYSLRHTGSEKEILERIANQEKNIDR